VYFGNISDKIEPLGRVFSNPVSFGRVQAKPRSLEGVLAKPRFLGHDFWNFCSLGCAPGNAGVKGSVLAKLASLVHVFTKPVCWGCYSENRPLGHVLEKPWSFAISSPYLAPWT